MSSEPSTSPSWIRTIGWAGLCLSLVTAIAGGVWSAVAEPEHVWSEQQAREFKAASEALHQALGSDHTHGPSESVEEAPGEHRRVAEARLAAIQAQLEAAQYAKNRAGLLLVQLGVGGAACCGALLFFTRER